MAYSRFTEVQLDSKKGVVSVSGPFSFGVDEPRTDVRFLRFALVQGDEFVFGDGNTRGGDSWDGEAPAGDLHAGAAQGFGVAMLVRRPQQPPDPPSPPAVQTFTWSEAIQITT
jgi:hypothetical protein